jgi:hypothetical protein
MKCFNFINIEKNNQSIQLWQMAALSVSSLLETGSIVLEVGTEIFFNYKWADVDVICEVIP